MPGVLGLDIGGANIKIAHTSGYAASVAFPLYRKPDNLHQQLSAAIRPAPAFDHLAITMTGELCDCFESRKEGVNYILDTLEAVDVSASIKVWLTDGTFVGIPAARSRWLQTASANWHALATWLGHQIPSGPGLVVDVGSTTSDITPLWNGKPINRGYTDRDRFRNRELVYTGVKRTPLTTLMGDQGAAELFATTEDIYLILQKTAERPTETDTADGRPATIAMAHARLARMLCADLETTTTEERTALAKQLALHQETILKQAVELICQRQPDKPSQVIVSGSGEFLAEAAIRAALGDVPLIRMASRLGEAISESACAYAVAMLAKEQDFGDE